MKKFRRIFLIVSGILAVLGIVLMIVGTIMGGTQAVADAFNSNRLAISFNDTFSVDDEAFDNMTNIYEKENRFSQSEIKSLVLKGNTGAYEVTVWDENDYCIQGIKGSQYVKYTLENGTLTVASNEKDLIKWGNSVKIKICIPKDAVLASVELSIGAGELICNDIQADTLSVRIGAGEGVLNNIEATNATFNVGAGECEINNGTLTQCDLEVGIGDIDFNGNISGNADIDCGIGNVELELNHMYEDFNYAVKVGAGEVQLGRENYSGLSNAVNLNNGSDKTMNIDCGMGEVSVEFLTNQ